MITEDAIHSEPPADLEPTDAESTGAGRIALPERPLDGLAWLPPVVVPALLVLFAATALAYLLLTP